MYKFENCKLCVTLEAQSPMIHFQGDSKGATLRGSELKPKLDRFLNNKIRELHEAGLINKSDIPYISKDRDALKYKVSIEGSSSGGKCNLDGAYAKAFMIIYADRKKKNLILRDCELTILCMNPLLQKLIVKYLDEFFAVTNFGYMQHKGFGSFMPMEYVDKMRPDDTNKKVSQEVIKNVRQEIGGWLRNKCGATDCYYIGFGNNQINSIRSDSDIIGYDLFFKEIKDFYDFLKTGRNFRGCYSRAYIYQYMHMKDIDNEKAWMKEKKIAPALKVKDKDSREVDDRKHLENPDNARYVRALLGLGPKVEFLNSCNAGNAKEKVIIKIKDNDKNEKSRIDRTDSPVFFKIINNYVFICADRIPTEIYGKEFKFSASLKHSNERDNTLAIKDGQKKSDKIPVPTEEQLREKGITVDDLLEHYVKYYNGEEDGEKTGERLRPMDGKRNDPKLRYAFSDGLKFNKYVRKCEV